MILQCDQCNTRFRLDDAKIKAGGVKVRCSKCKHVFVVNKEAPQDEADFDSILNGLGSSATVPSPAASTAQPDVSFQAAPGDFSAPVALAPAAASEETVAGEKSFAEQAAWAETRLAAGDEGFEFNDFSFTEEPDTAPSSPAVTSEQAAAAAEIAQEDIAPAVAIVVSEGQAGTVQQVVIGELRL